MEHPHLVNVLKKPRVWLPFIVLLVVFFIFVIYVFRPINAPATDLSGDLRYENKDLGFSMILPEDFQYFHVQRISENEPDYVDIEMFVPTADRIYPQEVPNYAKPLVVRIYDKDKWDELARSDKDGEGFEYLGIKNNKVYTIKFWDNIPSDWESIWSGNMRRFILEGFKIL
jgi:hypothetical protein